VRSYLHGDLFAGSKGGLVTLDDSSQGDSGYTLNHTYYAFKQFSAFTDPGWRRVEASTDSNDLRISAFISPDAKALTIVIINVSEIPTNLSLSLGDFSPADSAVYRTSETEHAAYIDTFDQSQPLSLGPRTITTVSLTTAADEPDGEIPQDNDIAVREMQ